MDETYTILKFLHILSFVFMSIPLFNLIVVNERAVMGAEFVYSVDRYMENIIQRGAVRCYVFQFSALVTGLLLLMTGPLGIESLWQNWVLLAKTVLLLVLTGLLSYVHFRLQPQIESRMAEVKPDAAAPENFSAQLKPFRVRRKRLATLCLFIVITIIILGVQVYGAFGEVLNIALILLAALFAWRVSKTLIRFGWV